MQVSKHDIPVAISAPGATVRQQRNFGTAWGALGAEHFSLAAGTDIAPLLEGLKDDACHAEHWGYVIDGELVVTYTALKDERCVAGQLFYWPAGHSVRVEKDAELIMFSPQAEHGAVFEHMRGKLEGAR